MPKQSGLGNNLYIDEYDLSGDAGSIQQLACPMEVQVVTGIRKFAPERIGLRHDGLINVGTFFNKDNTASAEGAHTILKGRPTTDRIVTYAIGTSIGSPAASLVTKQVTYDGNREANGAFTFSVNSQANGYGLEWGELLTAGLRTDTTATNGTSRDFTASTSFGWAAYLHMQAFTGTNVTVTIQDSADKSAWANLSGGGFTQLTARGKERIESATATATVRRYVRAITSGTFTSVTFSVNFVKFELAHS
jgi:hypothetical protein